MVLLGVVNSIVGCGVGLCELLYLMVDCYVDLLFVGICTSG
jgi:hypothetical protein